MLPKSHILFGAIFAIFLYLIFPITIIQTSLVFLSSFLIDFDHYIFGAIRKKTLNLKKLYFWHKSLGEDHKSIMHIFHSIEFIIILVILSYIFNFYLFILIGTLFHSILDLIEITYKNKWGCREFSLFRYLILNKKYPQKYF